MALSSNGKNVAVFTLTAFVLGIPAVIFVLQDQTAETNLLLVLRSLGRLSCVIFLLIVVIRPLQELIASPFTRRLLRNRRYVGIALASSMTVHLGFIVWRWAFVRGENIDLVSYLTGGVFYTTLYLMLITSFNKPAASLGLRNWRKLHRTGFWLLAIFFAFTFRKDVFKVFDEPVYFFLALLALAAVSIRVLAFLKLGNAKAARPLSETGID